LVGNQQWLLNDSDFVVTLLDTEHILGSSQGSGSQGWPRLFGDFHPTSSEWIQ